MLKNRVIPILLLKDSGLVKTEKFKNPKYIGDPINAIRIFNEKQVDELIVLDIDASKKNRGPDYSLIEQFASECFMPVTYGGGITELNQAERIFSLGIEKVSIQSQSFKEIDFIRKLSEIHGSQSIISSIDIKKNLFGQYRLYNSKDKKIIKKAIKSHIEELIKNGIGEILINSVDKDGTFDGIDIKMIETFCTDLPIPSIASGGVNSLNDFKDAVEAGANAVAAGAYFVFKGPHRAVLITYPEYSELELLFTNDK